MLRLPSRQNGLAKAALIVLAGGLLVIYVLYARGFEATVLIAVAMLCFVFNTLFLAGASRFKRGQFDIRGLAIFVGMLITNASILIMTDFSVWLLAIFWIPAVVGLLAGYFDRTKGKQGG